MFVAIVVLILVAGVFLAMLQLGEEQKRKQAIEEMGLNMEKVLHTGKYVHGHPDIDNPILHTFLNFEAENLAIYDNNCPTGKDWSGVPPKRLSSISLDSVEDVLVEDASSVERRVTVGRLALTGIFAFALKKKKKDELAYLTIKWKQGKFVHETFFEFEGQGAMSMANKARNALVRHLS